MSDPTTIKINHYSLATVPFSANRGEIRRPATAFLVCKDSNYFLVTALHVLTGRHWQTKSLSDNGLIPENFTLHVPFYKQLALREHELFWVRHELALMTDKERVDETAAPWLVHPRLREDVDVGIVPLADFPQKIHDQLTSLGKAESNSKIFAFDWNLKPKLATAVGDDVFVVGFPENIEVTGGMPIWKRGSVATEPDIPINDLPYFLVDTGTRSGMSGAPVLRRAPAGMSPIEDATKFALLSQAHVELVGVYSGRFGADDLTSQLGIVWKREVISEILATPTLGRSSLCTRLW